MADYRKTRTLAVSVVRLAHAEGLDLPAYQTDGSAGLDLVAAVDAKRGVKIARGGFAMIPTGLVMALPPGYEAQVRPRSGLAAKHGITVLNSPGTVDSDYRGEIKVLLINLGKKIFHVKRGERIAQIVLAPVSRASLREARSIGVTRRGDGGFGSTGVASPASRSPDRKKKSMPRKAAAAKKPLPGTRRTAPRRK
jgi:dUTP pyrophosphatase